MGKKSRSKGVDVTKNFLRSTSVSDYIMVQVSPSQVIQITEQELSPTQGSEAAFALRKEGKLDESMKLCLNWRAGACHNFAACTFAHVVQYFGVPGAATASTSAQAATGTDGAVASEAGSTTGVAAPTLTTATLGVGPRQSSLPPSSRTPPEETPPPVGQKVVPKAGGTSWLEKLAPPVSGVSVVGQQKRVGGSNGGGSSLPLQAGWGAKVLEGAGKRLTSGLVDLRVAMGEAVDTKELTVGSALQQQDTTTTTSSPDARREGGRDGDGASVSATSLPTELANAAAVEVGMNERRGSTGSKAEIPIAADFFFTTEEEKPAMSWGVSSAASARHDKERQCRQQDTIDEVLHAAAAGAGSAFNDVHYDAALGAHQISCSGEAPVGGRAAPLDLFAFRSGGLGTPSLLPPAFLLRNDSAAFNGAVFSCDRSVDSPSVKHALLMKLIGSGEDFSASPQAPTHIPSFSTSPQIAAATLGGAGMAAFPSSGGLHSQHHHGGGASSLFSPVSGGSAAAACPFAGFGVDGDAVLPPSVQMHRDSCGSVDGSVGSSKSSTPPPNTSIQQLMSLLTTGDQ